MPFPDVPKCNFYLPTAIFKIYLKDLLSHNNVITKTSRFQQFPKALSVSPPVHHPRPSLQGEGDGAMM